MKTVNTTNDFFPPMFLTYFLLAASIREKEMNRKNREGRIAQ